MFEAVGVDQVEHPPPQVDAPGLEVKRGRAQVDLYGERSPVVFPGDEPDGVLRRLDDGVGLLLPAAVGEVVDLADLDTLSEQVVARGGRVYLAKDATAGADATVPRSPSSAWQALNHMFSANG